MSLYILNGSKQCIEFKTMISIHLENPRKNYIKIHMKPCTLILLQGKFPSDSLHAPVHPNESFEKVRSATARLPGSRPVHQGTIKTTCLGHGCCLSFAAPKVNSKDDSRFVVCERLIMNFQARGTHGSEMSLCLDSQNQSATPS